MDQNTNEKLRRAYAKMTGMDIEEEDCGGRRKSARRSKPRRSEERVEKNPFVPPEEELDIDTPNGYKECIGETTTSPKPEPEVQTQSEFEDDMNTKTENEAKAESNNTAGTQEAKAEGFFSKLAKFPKKAWGACTNEHAGKAGLVVGVAVGAGAIIAATKYTEKGKCMFGGICGTSNTDGVQ